jgi:phosphoribosylaminoimidazole carboxylase PurE protein
MAEKPLVAIILGSASDYPVAEPAVEIFRKFGVPFDIEVSSAHRTPDRTAAYARDAEKKGIRVMIAIAGMAAHLPGVIAAHTTLPVIGVPVAASDLKGMDALLSIAQMPPGVPVACMGLGRAGGKNAALLAVQILALGDDGLAGRFREDREQMAAGVRKQSQEIRNRLSASDPSAS